MMNKALFTKITLLTAVAAVAISLSSPSAAQNRNGPMQEIPLPLATRLVTTNSADMFARQGDRALTVYAVSTSVTSDTITFTVQAKTPQGGYVSVLSSAGVTGAATTRLVVGSVTAATNAAVNEPVPPVFRVVATHAGTGSATYSIGVSRTN